MVCLYCRDLYAFVWTENNKALFRIANPGYKVSILLCLLLSLNTYFRGFRWYHQATKFSCAKHKKKRNFVLQLTVLFWVFFSSIASDLCKNRLNGLMVRVLSTLYRVFDSLSVQTTDYTIGICCTKYKGLGTKTGCTEEG